MGKEEKNDDVSMMMQKLPGVSLIT